MNSDASNNNRSPLYKRFVESKHDIIAQGVVYTLHKEESVNYDEEDGSQNMFSRRTRTIGDRKIVDTAITKNGEQLECSRETSLTSEEVEEFEKEWNEQWAPYAYA